MLHLLSRTTTSLLVPTAKIVLSQKSGPSFLPLIHKQWREFHVSKTKFATQPYLLADIGEGITECQIIQWFVKPGDRVEQFEAICEVQSDKAAVEITSRFDGVIRNIHYEVGDMAVVGKPLIDIEIKEGETPEPLNTEELETQNSLSAKDSEPIITSIETFKSNVASSKPISNVAKLATPAVRHMLKEFNVDIADIKGTGKASRVLKEDVQKHLQRINAVDPTTIGDQLQPSPEDRTIDLTPIQSQMFRTMTRSLTIPHFLFTEVADVTHLSAVRKRLLSTEPTLFSTMPKGSKTRLTILPFIIKALSQAFLQHPSLNSHLDVETDPTHPRLTIKARHDFGIAIDTPSGLLVPVVRDVQNHSILSLAREIESLSSKAREGKLKPEEFKDATFIISNMGSIGGNALSPIIVSPMVGIIGIGRAQEVPVFQKDEFGKDVVTKRERITLSWSGDHRVLDGATVAKCARLTASLLENLEVLMVTLK